MASPEEKAFNFSRALELMKEGRQVRRRCWTKGRVVYQIRTGEGLPFLCQSPEESLATWTPDDADLLAEDWETA